MPVIVSNIKARDGAGDTVEMLIAEAIPEIQRQPGCDKYALHRVRGRRHAGEFILIEKWADDAALARYGESPELISLHERLEPLIESLTDYLVVDARPYGSADVGAL